MFEELRLRATKAALAVCTSGAACAASSLGETTSSFIPTSLDGWMSVVASTLAIVYSLHLLWDWWKPFLKQRGWLQ